MLTLDAQVMRSGARTDATAPAERPDSVAAYVLAGVAVAVGLVYALAIRPGLPYDEASHFGTVQHYAEHLRMPVLGPGVPYEGYQAPAYYVIGAIVYRLTSWAGEQAPFYLLRLAGVAMLVPLVILTDRLARLAAPRRPLLVVGAIAFMALSPSLLAVAASVQNDVPAIVLAAWATLLALRWITPDAPMTMRRAGLLGLVVSVALLTKLTAAFLVPAIVGLGLWVQRGRAVRWLVVFGLVVAGCTGWWFVRNVMLYGELTGATAFVHHYTDPGVYKPAPLWELDKLRHFVQSIVNYAWLPLEYYDNRHHAPVWMKVIILAVMLAAAGGWGVAMCRTTRPTTAGALLFAEWVLCVLMLAYTWVTQFPLPARFTMVVLPVSALLIAGGVAVLGERIGGAPGSRAAVALLAAALLVINAYVIWLSAPLVPAANLAVF